MICAGLAIDELTVHGRNDRLPSRWSRTAHPRAWVRLASVEDRRRRAWRRPPTLHRQAGPRSSGRPYEPDAGHPEGWPATVAAAAPPPSGTQHAQSVSKWPSPSLRRPPGRLRRPEPMPARAGRPTARSEILHGCLNHRVVQDEQLFRDAAYRGAWRSYRPCNGESRRSRDSLSCDHAGQTCFDRGCRPEGSRLDLPSAGPTLT